MQSLSSITPSNGESWLRFQASNVPLSPFSFGKTCLETWADESPQENPSSLGSAEWPLSPGAQRQQRLIGKLRLRETKGFAQDSFSPGLFLMPSLKGNRRAASFQNQAPPTPPCLGSLKFPPFPPPHRYGAVLSAADSCAGPQPCCLSHRAPSQAPRIPETSLSGIRHSAWSPPRWVP